MGTRHLTCVFVDGQYKVAQYGQWDGYPEGAGVTVLKFLHQMDRPKFLANVNKTKQVTGDDVNKLLVECGHDPIQHPMGVRLDVYHKFQTEYPSVGRDIGAKILELIQSATEPVLLENGISFAGDSLFCEWCYVIDFDKNVLEVYRGFNKEPLTASDRFFSAPIDTESRQGYQQIKLAQSFALDALPDESVFLECFKTKENADDGDATDEDAADENA